MSNPGPASNSSFASPLISGLQLLFVLRGANLQLTQDQPFTRIFSGLTWDPQFITANYVSGAFNTSCLGGIFTLPGKGGNAIVSTGQSYSALTGPFTHTNCVVQANTTTFTNTPILSLSTANAASLFADFFIYGLCYD